MNESSDQSILPDAYKLGLDGSRLFFAQVIVMLVTAFGLVFSVYGDVTTIRLDDEFLRAFGPAIICGAVVAAIVVFTFLLVWRVLFGAVPTWFRSTSK